MKYSGFSRLDMSAAVRLLGESWTAHSSRDSLQLCNGQYTWKMAKGCTLQKQQSKKGLRRSHHKLHLQHTYLQQGGIFEAPAIDRVYTVSHRQGKCYYLRLLLHEVCGATCFDDLKRVSGEICSTFRQASHRRGLLENDNQYSLAL